MNLYFEIFDERDETTSCLLFRVHKGWSTTFKPHPLFEVFHFKTCVVSNYYESVGGQRKKSRRLTCRLKTDLWLKRKQIDQSEWIQRKIKLQMNIFQPPCWISIFTITKILEFLRVLYKSRKFIEIRKNSQMPAIQRSFHIRICHCCDVIMLDFPWNNNADKRDNPAHNRTW